MKRRKREPREQLEKLYDRTIQLLAAHRILATRKGIPRACHPDYWTSDGFCLLCGETVQKCSGNQEPSA